jgi:WD40 repeat protein
LASITSYDGKLIIWDIANSRAEKVLEIPSSLGNPVKGVKFSKDGKHLLLFAAREVRLYETTEWTYDLMKVTLEEIQVADLSPNGTRAIICKDNQEVVIWDFADERSLMTVRWPKVMTGAAFSYSGAYIAATSDDGWIKVWDVTTGDSVMEYHVCSGPCENAQFMIDDAAILCHDYDGFYLVNLYDMPEYVDYIDNTYGSYQLTPDELKQFYLE